MKKFFVTITSNTNVMHLPILVELREMSKLTPNEVDFSPNCCPGRFILTVHDEEKTTKAQDFLLGAIQRVYPGAEVGFERDPLF